MNKKSIYYYPEKKNIDDKYLTRDIALINNQKKLKYKINFFSENDI